jgi:Peptidase MA superfamily
MTRIAALLLAIALLLVPIRPGYAAQPPQITDRGAQLAFPNTITFAADLRAESELSEIVLEYGVEQRTCGEVLALAYPIYTPDTRAQVSWTWDMRQSGSLPPGATIWYRWRATDASGQQTTTETQRVTWLDATHAWQTVQRDVLQLHWYDGDRAFAQALLDSAVASLAALDRDTGLASKRPINIYVYSNAADLRDAVLYEPGWTGGLAYSEHSLTILGVAPGDLSWGRRVIAHELTHVLVGENAFTCVGSIPTWLNEGIAVYGEGGPEQYSLNMLAAAISNDTLLSVRSLSGGFSEDPGQADLSYVQSYSIVRFLISEYGREKLLQLFDRLASGDAIEPVLQATYGFGIDELDDRWRAAMKAKPRAAAGQTPTITPQPTAIATIVPIEPGSRVAANPTSVIASTVPSGAEVVQPTTAPVMGSILPPGNSTIFGWVAGILMALGVIGAGVLATLVFLRRRGR